MIENGREIAMVNKSTNIDRVPKDTVLYIVIPCYNEEEALDITIKQLVTKLNTLVEKELLSKESRILFIDDGSTDETWYKITSASTWRHNILGIKQSRNRGHQSSLLAGLMEAKNKADVVISMDCDGQDDIDTIYDMLLSYYMGYDIVYGVRSDRSTDSFFKRTSAQLFYKTLKWLGADTIYNHADFRLTSRRVLEELAKYKEVNLYLRGIFPLIGFKSTTVTYKRHERVAGNTHYPLSKMISLALNGITNLSTEPLRLITSLGFTISFLSILIILWILIELLLGKTIQGWASTLGIVSLLGGIQLLSLGIIGEYIGKIYLEVKHRPPYIIAERTKDNAEDIDKRSRELEAEAEVNKLGDNV